MKRIAFYLLVSISMFIIMAADSINPLWVLLVIMIDFVVCKNISKKTWDYIAFKEQVDKLKKALDIEDESED